MSLSTTQKKGKGLQRIVGGGRHARSESTVGLTAQPHAKLHNDDEDSNVGNRHHQDGDVVDYGDDRSNGNGNNNSKSSRSRVSSPVKSGGGGGGTGGDGETGGDDGVPDELEHYVGTSLAGETDMSAYSSATNTHVSHTLGKILAHITTPNSRHRVSQQLQSMWTSVMQSNFLKVHLMAVFANAIICALYFLLFIVLMGWQVAQQFVHWYIPAILFLMTLGHLCLTVLFFGAFVHRFRVERRNDALFRGGLVDNSLFVDL